MNRAGARDLSDEQIILTAQFEAVQEKAVTIDPLRQEGK